MSNVRCPMCDYAVDECECEDRYGCSETDSAPPQRRDALGELAKHARLRTGGLHSFADFEAHRERVEVLVAEIRRARPAGVPEAVRQFPERLREQAARCRRMGWEFADGPGDGGIDLDVPTMLENLADELDCALAQSERGRVPDSVYQSATKGRADFRAALRQKRNRLAQIERQVRELIAKWRKEAHGCCGCADELEAIIAASNVGEED